MVQSPSFRFDVREDTPILLQGDVLQRTDANSPVHSHDGRVIAFMSHYAPLGHTYRRTGASVAQLIGPLEKVRLIDNLAPAVGKWIESTWRSPSGRLYGWYHAEELAPCPRDLFIPHIGALVSDDGGLSWRCLGEILRAPADSLGCDYRNGFLAGGYGDCCVVADSALTYFYVYFSSYVSDESAQGVAVARYKVTDCDWPAGRVEIWCHGTWQPDPRTMPTPIFPAARAWKYPDPDSFWGPAIHFNRDIDAFVMLLNHTQNGRGNIVQEGIYISFNQHIEDPGGWTPPVCMVKGGVWYPETIGMGRGEGDVLAGSSARFFMSGFSAWSMRFSRVDAATPSSQPISIGVSDWVRLFGPTAPSRLGIG
jgi:hypothetical protein